MQYQNARTSLASVGTHMNLPVERPEGASFVHAQLHRRHRVQGRQLLLPRPRPGRAQEDQLPPQGRREVAIIGRIGSGQDHHRKARPRPLPAHRGRVLHRRHRRPPDRPGRTAPLHRLRAPGRHPVLRHPQAEHRDGRAPDDSAILAAADLAGVREFANTHPAGFEMPIGERGESSPAASVRRWPSPARCSTISGAAPRRTSSSMDHQSEKAQTAPAPLCDRQDDHPRHPPHPLLDLDRLIVLDQGQIVADGPKAQVVEASSRAASGRAG